MSSGGVRWSAYLRSITNRPGWSVLRLAEASGVHRSTIHDYISGRVGKKITVGTVLAIANAAGDAPVKALMAAAELPD